MPSRELKNLAPTLAQASAWGLTIEALAALVEKITVSYEWAAPEPEVRPLSFLNWLKQNPQRCPALWFALVEHSTRYLADPNFDPKTFEAWEAFANRHGVYEHEFRPAWRRWALTQPKRSFVN
jgi:hypothetical protein